MIFAYLINQLGSAQAERALKFAFAFAFAFAWGGRAIIVSSSTPVYERAHGVSLRIRSKRSPAQLEIAIALVKLRGQLSTRSGEAGAQQLKQVSILFADVVDSTALSQQLDPEDIHAVMSAALTGFTAVVQRHRGRVLQYAGDSMLAVFGAPLAHEDDAERAVQAGLASAAEGRAQGGLVKQRWGFEGFNVRVGIRTGAVLLGGAGGGRIDRSIRGIAVNLAARMEQSAPAGMLRISQAT